MTGHSLQLTVAVRSLLLHALVSTCRESNACNVLLDLLVLINYESQAMMLLWLVSHQDCLFLCLVPGCALHL